MPKYQLEYKGPCHYSEADCRDMELNPFDVPKRLFIFNHYEVFKRNKVFSHVPNQLKMYGHWTEQDLDILLRVIVLLIDPQSPLADQTDFDYRKIQSVLLVGANKQEHEWVLEEIDLERALFSSLTYHFFRLISDIDYQSWYSLKKLYDQICVQARAPIPIGADAGTINARMKLPQAIREAEKELKEKQLFLFKSKRLERLMIEESAKDEIGGFAEEFAEEPEWKSILNGDEEEDY